MTNNQNTKTNQTNADEGLPDAVCSPLEGSRWCVDFLTHDDMHTCVWYGEKGGRMITRKRILEEAGKYLETEKSLIKSIYNLEVVDY